MSCSLESGAQTSGGGVTGHGVVRNGVFVDWYILESEDCMDWTDSSASASSGFRFVGFESW